MAVWGSLSGCVSRTFCLYALRTLNRVLLGVNTGLKRGTCLLLRLQSVLWKERHRGSVGEAVKPYGGGPTDDLKERPTSQDGRRAESTSSSCRCARDACNYISPTSRRPSSPTLMDAVEKANAERQRKWYSSSHLYCIVLIILQGQRAEDW